MQNGGDHFLVVFIDGESAEKRSVIRYRISHTSLLTFCDLFRLPIRSPNIMKDRHDTICFVRSIGHLSAECFPSSVRFNRCLWSVDRFQSIDHTIVVGTRVVLLIDLGSLFAQTRFK